MRKRKSSVILKSLKEVDKTYREVVEYTCPIRGLVKEEVTITRYRAAETPEHSLLSNEISELLDAVSKEAESDYEEDVSN